MRVCVCEQTSKEKDMNKCSERNISKKRERERNVKNKERDWDRQTLIGSE